MALRLKQRFDRFRSLYRNIYKSAEQSILIARRAEVARLISQERYQDDLRLIRFGYKIYSQNDEDGILAEIFRRIGLTSRYFIEFGVGNGLENNTLALLQQGWRGLWIEGNPVYYSEITEGLQRTIGSGRLTVKQSFITRSNIRDLIASSTPPGDIDLLSIDIDGNDYHVWKEICTLRPRVVVIEYNAKFRPPTHYCMGYDEGHVWDGTDHYGASLSFLEKHFAAGGYSLVSCDLTGTNAFFVRRDCIGNAFSGPFTAELHYESAKFELVGLPSGHPPSFKTIENQMNLTADIEESKA